MLLAAAAVALASPSSVACCGSIRGASRAPASFSNTLSHIFSRDFLSEHNVAMMLAMLAAAGIETSTDQLDNLVCCMAHVARHTPYLSPRTSHLTRHISHLTPHTSHLIPLTSHLTPLTSHLTPHTSHLTPHTSHLTPHTSHLTPHTSHLAPHTSHLTQVLPLWMVVVAAAAYD